MAKVPEEEPETEADDESEEEAPRPPKSRRRATSVSIYEPMFVWISLLMIAVALKVIVANTSLVPVGSQVARIAAVYSGFILQFPGTIILPLIIGAIIGAEVGRNSSSVSRAARSGVLNGIYASVTYAIAIVVVYMIINYTTPQYATAYTVIFQDIIVPIAVFMATLETFALLSHLRRVE